MIRGMIRGYDSRKSNILPLLKIGHVKKRHSHLLITFRTPIDPGSIELRFSDITGDVFQVPRDRTILELLEEDRPMWRTHQPEFFANIPIPEDIDYPFIARFSCHVYDPRVILP